MSPAEVSTASVSSNLNPLASPIITPSSQPPRFTGNDLPDDVWQIIAQYVHLSPTYGYSLAFDLISVNRTFFNFVLSTKYREVHWVKFDKGFYTRLQRLQDPIVGRYVQKLFIRAWFIDLLLKRDKLLDSFAQRTCIGNVVKLINKLFFPSPKSTPVKSSPEYVGFEASHRAGVLSPGLPSKEIVRMLINAVSGMVNVTVLDFEWRDLPLNPQTAIFLTSTRTAFDSSLRKLVLKAQISKFKELLAITTFENIDELDFSFDYQYDQTDQTRGKAASNTEKLKGQSIEELHNTVIPFIRHRRNQLRSLAITSWDTATDLSEFFSSLPILPNLRRFSLCMFFDNKTLSDPSSILSVLRNGKSTLLHVSFQVTSPKGRTVVPFQVADAEIQRRKMPHWSLINDQLLADSSCLRNLESLEIPFVSIDNTVPIINRSCDVLVRLSLTDKYLHLQEITAVADIFRDRPFQLQHLHVEVSRVDFPVIRMLSRRFPGLSSLVLVFIVGPTEDTDLLDEDVDMERRALVDWKLTEFTAHDKRYQSQNEFANISYGVQGKIVSFFLIWVPSIRIVNSQVVRS